ncbi:hypothetical protein JYU34_001626 [Plutella xylostella]|uniref:Uncharacterized protein n=2 Tax=Plutella xylostella TaxID=51655 RepID=A0ABQ7R4G3_PLUXY|nr:hypothetical protein JYU34_001626 [Plutella xylostella]CAG9112018.1 unnamed protein product [Plutella xylostella]
MSHCAVHGCKTSMYNKPPGVSLHPCPGSSEMRSRWLLLLRNKCPMLDWSSSKLCSKHFENKYFDNQRNLKSTAIPTIFPNPSQSVKAIEGGPVLKTKMDRHLSKMTQAQLVADIKNTTVRLREPLNLSEFLTNDLQTRSDAPLEAKLWLLIKKQDHLNNRLMETIVKNKANAELAENSVEEVSKSKKDLEKNIETYKYIVKCLQEKQATLEEQIEILTAVESR